MNLTAIVKTTRVSTFEGQKSFDMLCVEQAPATLMDAFHIVLDGADSGPKVGDVITLAVSTPRRYPLDGRWRYDGELVANPRDGKIK